MKPINRTNRTDQNDKNKNFGQTRNQKKNLINYGRDIKKLFVFKSIFNDKIEK